MSHRALGIALLVAGIASSVSAQEKFDSVSVNLSTLYRLSKARTRSISPENFTGEKGKGGTAVEGTGKNAARELGQKWKVSPSVKIEPGATFTLAQIEGPGAIQHIWMTPTGNWRFSILRFYWDGEASPSVEAPVGDFFASVPGRYAQISSLPVAVNPGSAFNSYWVMPFRRSARITFENIDESPMTLYYQVTYTLTEIPADAGYFHAQFRRANPLAYKQDYVILDGVRGQGQYVGTHLLWGVRSNGWWGEGEVKFFMDGDTEFPTIAGTGTEDYFCGSYDFENPLTKQYQEFTTPYSGLPLVIRPDGLYQSQQRFSLYRWHIADPVRFERELRVTIQALGFGVGSSPPPSWRGWFSRSPRCRSLSSMPPAWVAPCWSGPAR